MIQLIHNMKYIKNIFVTILLTTCFCSPDSLMADAARGAAARSKSKRHCRKDRRDDGRRKRRCKKTTTSGRPKPGATPFNGPSTGNAPPVPRLDAWEQQMRDFGAKHCAALRDGSGALDPLLA